MKLYEISSEWQQIELALEESAGDLTPELEARIQALIAGGTDKLEAAAKVVKSLEGQAEIAKAEAKRLTERSKALENQVQRLRGLMLPALQTLGGKVKTSLFSMFTQTRTNVIFALKPGVDIYDLPSKFFRVAEPELNKVALKEAKAAGEQLPDCLDVQETETVSMVVR